MHFDPKSFDDFLSNLSATREQVDAIFSRSTDSNTLSDATMVLLWQSIYDVMLTIKLPEDRLKHASLIEKLFSAITDRRALMLREAKASPSDKTQQPLDAATTKELQEKLHII